MSVAHGESGREERNRAGAGDRDRAFFPCHSLVIILYFALHFEAARFREGVREVIAVGPGAPFRLGSEAPSDGQNVVGAWVRGIGVEDQLLAGHLFRRLAFESHVRITVGDVKYGRVFQNVGLNFLFRHFDLDRIIAGRHDDPFVEGIVVVVGKEDRVESPDRPADHGQKARGAFGGEMRNLSLADSVFAVGFHRIHRRSRNAFSHKRRELMVGIIGFQPVVVRDAGCYIDVLETGGAAA